MAIHKKLLEFQKLGITITKDAKNPHFKKSYASLNEVLDKVKGPLNDLKVIVVQQPGVLNDRVGMQTVLVDTEDDSQVVAFIPFVGVTDMQKLGGAITYARRYSLVSLLSLEDEDDDGNAVSGRNAAPKAAQGPSEAAEQGDGRVASTTGADFQL